MITLNGDIGNVQIRWGLQAVNCSNEMMKLKVTLHMFVTQNINPEKRRIRTMEHQPVGQHVVFANAQRF
ncbi:hypothetical protein A2U01_0024859 [Trifolium medium]|uniref:Uncharacterized protein n=1 Tax=Trifolium medium TaxID=97028 RepID=A0A392NVG4_9FABA|nr:hypothetical protein [Trifolium medium]